MVFDCGGNKCSYVSKRPEINQPYGDGVLKGNEPCNFCHHVYWHPNVKTVTLGVLNVYLAETPESLGHRSLNRVNECLCVLPGHSFPSGTDRASAH